jgi:alpha-ketoglutarate-dependent taurine dioxygenase
MTLATTSGSAFTSAASAPSGVRAYTLGEGQTLPLVVEPVEDGIVLAEWNARNREWVEAQLLVHGGVLFRNFNLPSPADFERAAKAVYGELFADYGDLPRNAAGEKIYESTPYPADQMILFHNESSHLPSWPMKISFHCVTPAKVGGCTPVFDTREVLKHIDPDVVEAFRTKGLMYVRNFSKGVDPTWEEFFHTTDKAKVEQLCRDAGSDFEWKADGGLRVINRTQGIVRHPKTLEEMFFNQVQIHHIYCVDEETRDGLRALFDEDDLPRNVYYGDGSPISDETMQHLGEVFEQVCVRFTWQKGDMIMLDNMLVTHARDTFEGPRQIVVAMGQMLSAEQLPAA